MNNQRLIDSMYNLKYTLEEDLNNIKNFIEDLKVISKEEMKELGFNINQSPDKRYIYFTKNNYNIYFSSRDYGRLTISTSFEHALDITVKNKEELLVLLRQLNLL